MGKKTPIELNNNVVLVTGAAGFIGAALCERLVRECKGSTIIGIDNLSDYYDAELKKYRLRRVYEASDESDSKWKYFTLDISEKDKLAELVRAYQPGVVVNLAAQPGVRYSIENPDACIESNIIGFYNLLEAVRHSYDEREGVQHLVYASSSSVYGGRTTVPFSIEDKVDNPVSLYAATKKSDELLAHAYSKLYDIPCTGLRFFTVYGPAGRPDMFYFSATNDLVMGKKIKLFNYGDMKRDFTYVDDIVEGVVRVMRGAPEKRAGEDGLPIPPYSLYNIGGGQPENLLDFVSTLQEELVAAGVLSESYDFKAYRELVEMQAGDVPLTCADSSGLEMDYGFRPRVGIREGLRQFCEWYAKYYSE